MHQQHEMAHFSRARLNKVLICLFSFVLDSTHDAVENLMLRINDDNGQCSGWTCTQCEKITSIKSHMREHIEGFHIKDFKLFCKFCSREYRTRRSLRNHYQKKHKDENPLYYNC